MTLQAIARGEWRCDGCGAVGEWAPGWKYLGVEETRGGRQIVERVLCPVCPIDRDTPVLR